MIAGYGVVCGETMMMALTWCGLWKEYDDSIVMVWPVETVERL